MRKKILELSVSYIADSIIEVKKKRFNEKFTTLDEVNIVKKIMENKFERCNLNVKITDVFFKKYFNIVNGVITKSNDLSENLKDDISNIEICEAIYDEKLIYLCICEMMVNKLYNSIEHNCLNCSTECCGRLKQFDEEECSRWTYDFKGEAQKGLHKLL